MSDVKPLTREEREMLVAHLVYPERDPATAGWDGESFPDEWELHRLWEATVQAAEADVERLRAENDRLLDRVWRLRNAVSVAAVVVRFPSHALPLREALEVDGNLAALTPPGPSGGEG